MNNLGTFTLKHPLELRSVNSDEPVRTITTVTVRRPVGRDMLLLDQHRTTPMKLTLAMIGQLSDLPPGLEEKLDVEDAVPLGELAMSPFADGLPTGETV